MDRERLKGLGSRWPVLLILAAFLVGLVARGFFGGVLLAMFSLPIAGLGYIIQSRFRRRRGVAASGRWLDRDANDAVDAAILAVPRVITHYRSARLAVLAVSCAVIAFWWLVAGRWWGLTALVLMVPGMARVSGAFKRRRDNR